MPIVIPIPAESFYCAEGRLLSDHFIKRIAKMLTRKRVAAHKNTHTRLCKGSCIIQNSVKII